MLFVYLLVVFFIYREVSGVSIDVRLINWCMVKYPCIFDYAIKKQSTLVIDNILFIPDEAPPPP